MDNVKTDRNSEQERMLDQGLEQSFPASDPNSSTVTDTAPVRPFDRKPARIDQAIVKKLSDDVKKKLDLDE